MREYLVICVDDDRQFLDSLENSLPDRVVRLCPQFSVTFDFVSTPHELFELLRSAEKEGLTPGMVISDQVMPGISGVELLEQAKAQHPDLVCILLTGHAGLESAKYAINRQLLDQYVCKPIEDLQEFAALAANLLKRRHLGLEEKQRTAQLADTISQLRESNEKIRAMHAAAEQVAMLSKGLKSLDFDEVVDLIKYQVPQMFDARWGVMCLEDGSSSDSPAVHRHHCPCPQEDLKRLGEACKACQSGAASAGQPGSACASLGAEPPNLLIPLTVQNLAQQCLSSPAESNGYLCLCRLADVSAAATGLLEYKGSLLRDVLSANLTNARLYQQARRDSQIDPLTGTGTRKVLEEKLEAEHERAIRYGRCFCVAVIDVDNFKAINDKLGHAIGDEALRSLAKMLRTEVRGSDIVIRYGGDEFVLLMPETRLEAARAVVERLRLCAEEGMEACDAPLTISCGVAEWSGKPTDTGATVLRQADAALYEAKRAGRNRVHAASAAAVSSVFTEPIS